jgi:hypothetical protein
MESRFLLCGISRRNWKGIRYGKARASYSVRIAYYSAVQAETTASLGAVLSGTTCADTGIVYGTLVAKIRDSGLPCPATTSYCHRRVCHWYDNFPLPSWLAVIFSVVISPFLYIIALSHMIIAKNEWNTSILKTLSIYIVLYFFFFLIYDRFFF